MAGEPAALAEKTVIDGDDTGGIARAMQYGAVQRACAEWFRSWGNRGTSELIPVAVRH